MENKNQKEKTNKRREMMKLKNYSDKSKGITLIALVITIIVLLILAGVSIAMLTGENGILNKADTARKNTEVAGEREQIAMAYNVAAMEKLTGEGEVDVTKIIETELKKQNPNVQVEETTGEDGTSKTKVTFTDTKNTYEVDNETGEITGPQGTTEDGGSTPSTEDTTGPTVSDNVEYTEPVYTKPTPPIPAGGSLHEDTETGEKVPIPKGFAFKEGTVKTGLVIQETGTDKSEFVWIPVPYVVATGEDTAEEKIKGSATITISAEDESGIGTIESKTDQNIEEKGSETGKKTYQVTENGEYVFEITDTKGNSTEHKVQVENIEEIITGNKAMAVNMNKDEETKETEPQYRGLLYNFSAGSSGGASTSEVMSECTTSSNGAREPANLTGNPSGKEFAYDSQKAFDEYGGGTWTEEMYQSEYNEMIKSVKTYGGFYVGRYEMSLTGAKNEEQGNGTAQSKGDVRSSTADKSNTNRWYGLYAKAKTYANDSNQGTTITDSGVISSMIWGSQWDAMLNWMQGSGIDVASKTAGGATYNDSKETGKVNDPDKINNIYDLIGCNREWILEAYRTYSRGSRGGYSASSYSPSSRLSNYNPADTSSFHSTRLTLYIK